MKQTRKRIHPEHFLFSLLTLFLMAMAFAEPVHAWITSCPTSIVSTFVYDETLIEEGKPPVLPEEPEVPEIPILPEGPDGPSLSPSPETPEEPDNPSESPSPEEPDDPSESPSPEIPEEPDGPSVSPSPETPDGSTGSGSNKPSGSIPPSKPTTPPGTGVRLAAWDLAVLALTSAIMLVIWAPYWKKEKPASSNEK